MDKKLSIKLSFRVLCLCFFLQVPTILAAGWLVNTNIQQGDLMVMQVPVGTKAFLDNKRLKLSKQGDLVFGFGRDAKASFRLKLIFPDGKVSQNTLAIKQRQYITQSINGIHPKYLAKKKKPMLSKRIKRENKAVKAARNHMSPQLSFKQDFTWPIKGKVTGVFGSQRVYNGELGRPHYGLDLAAPVGTLVKAPADGIIRLAGNLYYSGGTVILDHGFGVSSTFLHLSKVLVKPGEKVLQGQVIAKVGSTGKSTGPHLDWRMNWFGERLDPELLMNKKP